MPTEFRLPQLTESMATVKLSTWLKKEGDRVTQGEPIAEVETDKTSVELEAPESGVLTSIRVPAGSDKVAAGTVIAIIGAGEAGAAPKADAPSAAAQARSAPAPVATAPPPAVPAPPVPPPPDATRTAVAPAVSAPAGAADVGPTRANGDARKVASTALAAKMAQVAGIDLGSLGIEGRRITKADVQAALRAKYPERQAPAARMPSPPEPAASFPVPATGRFEDRPLSGMRRVTAARLQQAKQVIPHFYLQADCRADALLDLRARINATNAAQVTVTDLIVSAAALALRRVPEANAAWLEGSLRVFQNVDIAVAVATPQGLITPIVRGCESKSIATISRDLKDLSERARAGKLTPEEYTNGTFTISNLGMFGVTTMTPIINPPQACILGVGAIEERAVVQGGAVVPGHVVSLTLAADHRALDGITGAQFLQQLKTLVEQPMTIALGL